MTPSSQTSSSSPLGRPHKEYFITEADTTFKVENTLFKVHRYFFVRESPYFEKLFRHPAPPCNDPPGLSETNPVVLKDTTSEGFASLLGVFYNRKYSVYNYTIDQWTRILDLAQRWQFKEVEELCVRELEKIPISSVEKIELYQVFKLNRGLLAESFAKLTLRDEPLSLAEGRKLGIDTAIQITQARERTRHLNSGMGPTGADSRDLFLIIRDVFELKEEDLDSMTDPAPGPPPQPQPQQKPPTSDIRKRDKKL